MNLPLIFQNPPNTCWEGVKGPPKGNLREVFRGPNTYSQNICQTSALQHRFHVERHNLSFARCSPSWRALPGFCRVKPGSFRSTEEIPRFKQIPWRIHGTDIFTYMNGWFFVVNVCRYTMTINGSDENGTWMNMDTCMLHDYPKFSKDCNFLLLWSIQKERSGKSFWNRERIIICLLSLKVNSWRFLGGIYKDIYRGSM